MSAVRTRNLDPALDLSPYAGLELRLKGDGRRYKLILRTGKAPVCGCGSGLFVYALHFFFFSLALSHGAAA